MQSRKIVKGRILFTLLIMAFSISIVYSQDEPQKDRHEFKTIIEIPTTEVKSQNMTGTCWSFATTSFIETEMMRLGKGEHDLSEMYFVKHSYLDKGEKYIRYQGAANFGEGGQAHDVFNTIKKYGIVPESVFEGNKLDGEHNHTELANVLQAFLDAVLKKKKKLTPYWNEAYSKVVDVYLGEEPKSFEYNGKKYTPESFAKESGINPDDYVELTSFSHHPFYEKFILEIPDNWTHNYYYNIPIDEIIEVIDNSLNMGYSVCWDGDSGRENFLRTEGYAVVPDKNSDNEDKTKPEAEMSVTQELRQDLFNDFTTTDDHLMHITGSAENQEGTKFYYTKNSWGTKDKKYNGYWYMSEQYVKLNTIAVIVHKDVLTKDLKSKLKIK
ncbi:MAG: aminopeptidase [Bacteroidetes bacterium]|nr:aminopeptidase [Bacteroidota bacterium]